MAGISYQDYWSLEPIVIKKMFLAYDVKIQTQDRLNWVLGKYIGFAVNDPKKYPEKPYFEKPKVAHMSGEEMKGVVKRLARKTGGKVT